MEFSELINDDKEEAFLEWFSVKQAKEAGIIPASFADVIPDRCTCGSENMITQGATQMTCCNPKCEIKVGFAIAEVLTRFGIKGLKEATCSKIYKEFKQDDKLRVQQGKESHFKYNSYLEVFTIPWKEYPYSVASTTAGYNFYQAALALHEKKVTFPKLISNLGIPELGSDAENLFYGISGFPDFCAKVKEKGTISDFCESRGYHAASLKYYIRAFKTDIMFASLLFNNSIRTAGAITLCICMTGSITLNGGYTTKDRFIESVNDILIGDDGFRIAEVKMNTAKATNSFIVYSNESGDSKFITGKNRGITNDILGKHPVLIHSNNFYKIMQRTVAKWNKLDMEFKKTLRTSDLWTLMRETTTEVTQELGLIPQEETTSTQNMQTF